MVGSFIGNFILDYVYPVDENLKDCVVTEQILILKKKVVQKMYGSMKQAKHWFSKEVLNIWLMRGMHLS